MKKVYIHYTDPGHGWVKVHYDELVRLDIADQITSCSYTRDGWVYLEEDGDASRFAEAKLKHGEQFETRTRPSERTSKIRNYDRYPYTGRST